MQLTKQTDFAFRVLIYLASQPEGKLSNIQAISNQFDISKNHLMKVVQKLVNSGLVNSIRGHNGGIYLGKPATDIVLSDVVELMEKTLRPVNCQEPICKIIKSCELKHVLAQAQNHFINHLKQFTLDSILNDETKQEIIFLENDTIPTLKRAN